MTENFIFYSSREYFKTAVSSAKNNPLSTNENIGINSRAYEHLAITKKNYIKYFHTQKKRKKKIIRRQFHGDLKVHFL